MDVDDVGFARALVEAIAAEAPIDLRRVYPTGLSNGGAMTHRLGCEAADTFAAIAPMAFPLALVPRSTCQPSRPIAVIYFAGLTDTLIPYDGGPIPPAGPVIPSAPDSFAYWRDVTAAGTAHLTKPSRLVQAPAKRTRTVRTACGWCSVVLRLIPFRPFPDTGCT